MKIIDKPATIIKVAWKAFGAYKLQIATLTGLGFLNGFLGGIGINAIIPLFSFVTKGKKGDDLISRYIEQAFNYLHIDFTLKYLFVFIILLFILKALILLLFTYINTSISSKYEEETRNKLLKDVLKADWPYLLKQKLGHLETALMRNIENSKSLLGSISSLIMIFASMIAYMIVAINISVPITLITFGIGSLLFFVLMPLIRKMRSIAHENEKIHRQVAHYVNENIIGMKTVKIMSVGDQVVEIGKSLFAKIRKINIKVSLLSSIFNNLLEPISIIFISIIFAIYYKTGNFNLASLIVIIYLIKQIFAFILNLQKRLVSINGTFPYLQNVLNCEMEAIKYQEKQGGSDEFQFNNSFEFKEVYFSYNSDKDILSKVSFKIKKGEMIGLIGQSGAGKTTLVDLVLRLFEPSSGEILLDGKNISEINIEDWRKNVGYVSQDIFLMNDTIANNIRFYNNPLTDAEIEEAAKTANIYEFIQDCPDKFSTVIGERGVMLSGGQRQRIIIARVLARKPKFLILDEATSALDNQSEMKIKEVIEKLKGKITILTIAHRLSTVISSDKLIVLEKGKIIEEDHPVELLKNKDSYFYKNYHLRK